MSDILDQLLERGAPSLECCATGAERVILGIIASRRTVAAEIRSVLLALTTHAVRRSPHFISSYPGRTLLRDA